jgi:hypothetical protein
MTMTRSMDVIAVKQISAIVIFDNGAHLFVNNDGAPWPVFRQALLQTVLDCLMHFEADGVHVRCATLAHYDHFHQLDTMAEVFEVLGRQREAAAACDKTCH